jgi:hypothetical protein
VARVHGTWAQGLAVAVFGLDLLSSPRVDQSDYETLVDSAPFGALFGSTDGLNLGGPGGGTGLTFRAVDAQAPATPLFGLAAGGVAMRALLGALSGARSLRPINFGSTSVQGMVAGGPTGFAEVIVNLSRKPFAITLPAPLRGLPYTERAAAPITLVAGLTSLREYAGTTGTALELEPFSLVAIGKQL